VVLIPSVVVWSLYQCSSSS